MPRRLVPVANHGMSYTPERVTVFLSTRFLCEESAAAACAAGAGTSSGRGAAENAGIAPSAFVSRTLPLVPMAGSAVFSVSQPPQMRFCA